MTAGLVTPTFCSTRSMFVLMLWTVCLSTPPAALTQEVTGSFTGNVVDASSVYIVGATLTAKDTDRGTTYKVQTNGVGVFSLPRVPVGTYELKVEALGFQTAVYHSVTLVLNQTARVDFQLKVGQATESIDVTSIAPLLQTDSTQLSTVMDSNSNINLPLRSRNYIQLTLLAPGSVHPDPQTLNSGEFPWSAGRPYINGNREQANNFLLDGMGTTSSGGRAASRENRQIPRPKNRTNNAAANDTHRAFSVRPARRLFGADGGAICKTGLTTGAMKRYPRRGRVSTNRGLSA